MDVDLEAVLARFGLSGFRPGQREVISAVLRGEDCLCVMPTGGGKSLCYQLPAMILPGLTLVVSPLIALMKDQVDQLQSLGLPVSLINSTLPLAEQHARLEQMAAGRYRLVYVVPERFRNRRFMDAVARAGLKLLAVDEAHCISEWGHDFRPDYARLGYFRRLLGRPPTIALTATATDRVRRDIVEQLDLREPKTFLSGFARPNLFYEVQCLRSERQKPEILMQLLGQMPGSGIVYTSTRKRAEEVAEAIGSHSGRRAAVYHAGLLPEQRRQAQETFMEGRCEIVVATNAFGMGIDKADVRFVIHYNLPGTLEAYYQEAGRAGRDGMPSRCLLLYHAADRMIQEYFIETAYPAEEHVRLVYDFLRSRDENPIELTQAEVKERLGLPIGAEGVGHCEQLLEGAGVLERLPAAENLATLRIDSDLPTLVDLLPKQAKRKRRVLQLAEKLVGRRRHELVYVHPRQLASNGELDPAAVVQTLRELNRLEVFTYIPPFRGRAIRMIRRELPFEKLAIDFAALRHRKKAEYEKLGRVIQYALSRRCRQDEILAYFGEAQAGPCGHCDNCEKAAAAGRGRPSESLHPKVVETIRIVLSGAARTEAALPCGKGLLAQMLCGSSSARLAKLGLTRLSTYGLLQHLRRREVVALIDCLIAVGCLRQVEIGPMRPVVKLTGLGADVMRQKAALTAPLPLPGELLRRLTGEDRASSCRPPVTPEAQRKDSNPPDARLLQALRQWRQQEAAAWGVPRYRILPNKTLEALARLRPDSSEGLLAVAGIGPAKLGRFGQALLEILTDGEFALPKTSSSSQQPSGQQQGRSTTGARSAK